MNSPPRTDRELQLLQFLCHPRADVRARGELFRILAEYHWLDADHEVLFGCISDLFSQDTQHILEHLPAVVTRRGFPDISCDSLVTSSPLAPHSALARARDLLHASRSSLDAP